MMKRLLIALIAAVAVLLPLSAASAQTAPPTVWMFARTALVGVESNATVAKGLSSDTVYQVSNPASTDTPATSNAIVSFHTYGGTATASLINGGKLPAGTRAIVLDQEDWQGSCASGSGDPCTPQADLNNPVAGATTASTAAKAKGLTMITTPALDLFDGSGSLPCSTSYWQCYLNYDLAGKEAAVSNVIDIQAQSLETTPATYLSFVQQAAAQARAANPAVVVLAGLSTSPNTDATPSAAQLEQDVSSTRGTVSGFWFNIPDQDNALAIKVMLTEGVLALAT
jgi:hypothetical protein